MKSLIISILSVTLMSFLFAVEKEWSKLIEQCAVIKQTCRLPYVKGTVGDFKPQYVRDNKPETSWCFDVKKSPSILFRPTLNHGLSPSDFKKNAASYDTYTVKNAVEFLTVRTKIAGKKGSEPKRIRLHYYELDVLDDPEGLAQAPREVFNKEFEINGSEFEYDFKFSPQIEHKGGLVLVARVDVISLAGNVAKLNVGCIAELKSTIPDQK